MDEDLDAFCEGLKRIGAWLYSSQTCGFVYLFEIPRCSKYNLHKFNKTVIKTILLDSLQYIYKISILILENDLFIYSWRFI